MAYSCSHNLRWRVCIQSVKRVWTIWCGREKQNLRSAIGDSQVDCFGKSALAARDAGFRDATEVVRLLADWIGPHMQFALSAFLGCSTCLILGCAATSLRASPFHVLQSCDLAQWCVWQGLMPVQIKNLADYLQLQSSVPNLDCIYLWLRMQPEAVHDIAEKVHDISMCRYPPGSFEEPLDVCQGVNASDFSGEGWRPLHFAAAHGLSHAIHLLVSFHADLNAQQANASPDEHISGLRSTPLHLAAARGHHKAMHTLLSLRANVNARNCFHDTPLHTAVQWKQSYDICKILITHRADVNAKDNLSFTSIDWAEANDLRTLAWELRTYRVYSEHCLVTESPRN